MHHQYSSSVSPFQAKTGTPCGSSGVPFGPTAIAAAAWSWVEKMLQLAQRTSAPSSVSVSMRTAVWMVMWSEPVIRAPARGFESANSRRVDIRPGISCSARRISLRPYSARLRSATLKSFSVIVAELLIRRSGSPKFGGYSRYHSWSVMGTTERTSQLSASPDLFENSVPQFLLEGPSGGARSDLHPDHRGHVLPRDRRRFIGSRRSSA